MNTILIITGAAWIYPMLSLMIVRMTSEHIPLRRKIFLVASGIVLLTIFCMLLGICTRSSYFNVWMVTNIYFVLCMGLWWLFFGPYEIPRVLAGFVLCGMLGMVYLEYTLGSVKRSSYIIDWSLAAEAWAGKRISVKAFRTNVGDFYTKSGLRVEVHKTVPFLSFLQYKVCEREYAQSLAFCGKVEARYNEEKGEVYMAVIAPWGIDTHTMEWGDTIQLP